jgi:cytochrome c oxidase cbb3-type subunit 2
MNSGPILFFGLLASMAVSWMAFVLGPVVQLGGLQQTTISSALKEPYPNNVPGQAHQGAEIYRANGCAYCHTQQVRPTELGPDLQMGWGTRRSVAPDYIYSDPVMLGSVRIGPDLANAGSRMDETAVLLRLYEPRIVNPTLDAAHSLMPSYRYLFDVHKVGRLPSTNALTIPDQYMPQGPDKYEVIPRPAARALAAYVSNLRQSPYVFEAPPPLGWKNPADATNAPGTNAPGTNAPAMPATNSTPK